MQQTSSSAGIATPIALLRRVRGCASPDEAGNSIGSADGTGKSVAMHTPYGLKTPNEFDNFSAVTYTFAGSTVIEWGGGYVTIRRLPNEDITCGYDLNQTVTEDVVEINFRVIDVRGRQWAALRFGAGECSITSRFSYHLVPCTTSGTAAKACATTRHKCRAEPDGCRCSHQRTWAKYGTLRLLSLDE